MENQKVKLTIAIPTYNRCSFLLECIDSVISQLRDDIEIIISDNASTDNTKEAVQPYLKYPFIKYYRNQINLGMDGNFLNCLKKAKGEYIHLLSDDDIMCVGALDIIINCINTNQPDMIFLNSSGFTGKYRPQSSKKAKLSLKKDIITVDKNIVLETVGIYITYLSGLVIKKENFNKIPRPEKYLGTYLLQAHIVLLSTFGRKKIAIIKNICIASRHGNTGGYNLYQVWVKEYKRLLLETGVIAGYNKKKLEELYVNSIKNEIYSFILNFRLNNTGFDLSNRKILINKTYMYPSVWFKVYPVAFAPIKIIKLIKIS